MASRNDAKGIEGVIQVVASQATRTDGAKNLQTIAGAQITLMPPVLVSSSSARPHASCPGLEHENFNHYRIKSRVRQCLSIRRCLDIELAQALVRLAAVAPFHWSSPSAPESPVPLLE